MNALKPRAGTSARLATMVVALSVFSATPALAASSYTYRSSGRAASAWWTQVDGTDVGTSPVGNVHQGWLNAERTTKGNASVFGYIEDWDCEDGEEPGYPGHSEGEYDEQPPAEEGLCDYMGSRRIEAYRLKFTFDKELGSARLTGKLTVYGSGHGTGVVGRPVADIVWKGFGPKTRSEYTSRWREGGSYYRDSSRSISRNTRVSGTMGPMGFDRDLSGGNLSIYRSSSRSRTP